jgi:flagellar biosynthesis protein FlhG
MLHSAIEDQASGLRRLLGKPETQRYVVISAIGHAQKNIFLLNLASSFIHQGSSAHLLDTRMDNNGVSARNFTASKLDLAELAQKNEPLHHGYYEFMQGGRISKLAAKPTSEILQSTRTKLSKVIEDLSSESNIWILDSEFNDDNPLLIPEFTDSHVLLLVTSSAQSIKNGYSYLKKIARQVGRRKVGLLVLNTDEDQALLVYKNMSSAANQFLSIQLQHLGTIPFDEHISMAAQLGKAIIEAFPTSKASNALKSIVSELLETKMRAPVTPPPNQLNHLVLEH